jgi:hypothetical protein
MKTTKNHTRRCHDGGSRLDDDNHIGAWTKADLSDATDGSGDKILTRDPEGYILGGDASTNRASRPWPTRGYQHGGINTGVSTPGSITFGLAGRRAVLALMGAAAVRATRRRSIK